MERANKHSQVNGLLSPLLQRLRIKKAIPFVKGTKILDIGSSNGELLKFLPPDIDYIGVEGNRDYYNYARRLYPKLRFINKYIDGLNSDDLDISKRDTIFMLALLEHLKYPIETLIFLKEYLSNSGRIIITTPSNFSEPFLKIGSKLRLFTREMDEHENHFSKKELFKVSKKADLTILHYERFELGMNHLIVLENTESGK